MKEIILKRYGSSVFLLEILEDNLRIYIGDNDMGASEDFSLEEIDDLQEAISIMKDKLSRKLSCNKETFEFELPKTMSVKDFEELIGCKCKPSNEKLTVIVEHSEQKDVNIVSDNEQKVVYGGEIADFPVEIVERMLECQVEQGDKRDVSVFERNKIAGVDSKGFDWIKTKEGARFWIEVIAFKNFDTFFQKYPKK